MKASDRGPYRRIAWFCNDGTRRPPVPYACRDHGGGRQHGEYSDARDRLAALGWPVGTVVAALTWDELWDEERRHLRLRQIPIERYLEAVDDGWVLRRARGYRGRVQVEDEESAGRDLLVELLSRTEWVRGEFLLAREATRALPHHGGTDRTRRIRQLAEAIAGADASFAPLRIKIHTSPDSSDAGAVRAWLGDVRVSGDTAARADTLARAIDDLFSAAGRRTRLTELRRSLAVKKREPEVEAMLGELAAEPPSDAERVEVLARLLRTLRERIESSGDGARNLELMDLSREAEADLVVTAMRALGSGTHDRRSLAGLTVRLLDATYGVGLFSAAERDAAAQSLRTLPDDEVTGAAWLAAARALRRTGPWALGTVRATFAEPLATWPPLEPKAARFADELLRGSPALPLAEAVRILVADAEAIAATPHRAFGAPAAGFLGLNPGVAVGVLRYVSGPEPPVLDRKDIVALPHTVSDLSPVAGILTLAEGNLLSHVQILARNLGIPNAVVSRRLRRDLQAAEGESVLVAVGSSGSVVVERWADLPDSLREAMTRRQEKPAAKVAAPVPDVTVRDPIPLPELHGGLSGRVVGPKAANLGDLARAFPGRVAPAVALPFGIFAEHVGAGPGSPKGALERAFASHRRGEIDDEALATAVEDVRAAIAAVTLRPEVAARIAEALADHLGETSDRPVGVFVRSDTNVEDLPGFTGAGLNETVANVVGLDAQLAAVPRVWASPFRQRPMAWRSQLLERPEDVYTSVLLMKSVPSDKSGVLVTTDLVDRGEGLTVATSWGVGGAVDNETAETLVLLPDGGVKLVSEAKAPYRRRLSETGGVGWAPAPSGAALTEAEQEQLRALAAEVSARFPAAQGPTGPQPWDIEFGFVGGELTLFQIRPLVERGQFAADGIVEALVGRARPSDESVRLFDPPHPTDSPGDSEP
ncbi:MAG TPA: PEP/pyruvate-binding domain-containing protein [bacterium]|nr:PEP/pyruvate-binding domain-containing protein [bacterium]